MKLVSFASDPMIRSGSLVFYASAVLLSSASVRAATMSLWGEYFFCTLQDSPGLRTVYVVQEFSLGTTAVRFKIVSDPSITMTYVSETHPFAHSLGNTQEGLSVCFDDMCLTGTTIVAEIKYMGYGTSAPCSFIRVVPHPLAETLDMMDCAFNPQAMSAYRLEVPGGCNYCVSHMGPPDSYPGTPMGFGCEPLPTRASTWGRIKSLYSD